jgi:hypothetical protein
MPFGYLAWGECEVKQSPVLLMRAAQTVIWPKVRTFTFMLLKPGSRLRLQTHQRRGTRQANNDGSGNLVVPSLLFPVPGDPEET